MTNNQTVSSMQDDEINLMDLLLVIAKHNRFILKLTVGAAVLAVIYALLQPNIYTAKTVIMPPQQASSSSSVLLGQLGGLSGIAGGALGIKNPGDLYVGMLKSRTVADALIQRYKLLELYDVKTMNSARLALEKQTVVISGKDGFITVEFSDKNPKLAAAIANSYVEQMDSLAHVLATQEALVRKQFYEKQLNDVRAKLAKDELDMKSFEEKNRVFKLGGNGSLELGASGEIPQAEIEYIRIAREVKYQEMLLGAMAQQVSSATIDAAKDAAAIQVMDKAEPPEKKSGPKRALIVMLATFVALFAGIIWSFVKEAGERSRQVPEHARQLDLLRRYFRQGK